MILPKHPLLVATCLAVSVFLSGTVRAEVVGAYKNWTALAEAEGSGKVCFIVSVPEKSEPGNVNRGDIYMLVTHRPHEKSIGVVNMQAGYPYKARSEAAIRIGSETFRLFTDGENAWAPDEATDRALVGAMKGGNTMVVTGVSSRDTKTTDTFSLSGFTAAYSAASKACGIKP